MLVTVMRYASLIVIHVKEGNEEGIATGCGEGREGGDHRVRPRAVSMRLLIAMQWTEIQWRHQSPKK